MTQTTLLWLRKRGWRLKVDDDGKLYKATLWRGKGDGVETHTGKGETLDAALQEMGKQLALSNMVLDFQRRGIFPKPQST